MAWEDCVRVIGAVGVTNEVISSYVNKTLWDVVKASSVIVVEGGSETKAKLTFLNERSDRSLGFEYAEKYRRIFLGIELITKDSDPRWRAGIELRKLMILKAKKERVEKWDRVIAFR
jgi:hypothetical protein